MFRKLDNLSPFTFPVTDAGIVENPLVVDQFEGMEFNKAANGFAKNLIAQIMEAESEELRNQLMKRLVDMPKGSLPDDMPAYEAVKSICPKSVNSVATFRDWAGSLDNTPLAKAVDDYKSKLDKIAADKEALRQMRLAELEAKNNSPKEE